MSNPPGDDLEAPVPVGEVEAVVRQPDAGYAVVALLCPEARLRRILRLALQADGYDPVEWGAAGWPLASSVAAVVADLDGLRWRPATAIAAFRASGVGAATALLLISVYPPEPTRFDRLGPLEYLQPPFAPAEFTDRLRHLLASGGPSVPQRPNAVDHRAGAAGEPVSDPAACSRAADV